MDAVLADRRTAPIDAKLSAMLDYIEKLTLTPDAIGPADVEPLRAVGLSDQAITDGVQVCALFNLYNRLSDSMGWDVPADPKFWKTQAGFLLKRGYE